MSEKSYEDSVRELEEIVQKLESGNVPLKDMVALYEKGEKLYKACAAQLDEYEKRLNANREKADD